MRLPRPSRATLLLSMGGVGSLAAGAFALAMIAACGGDPFGPGPSDGAPESDVIAPDAMSSDDATSPGDASPSDASHDGGLPGDAQPPPPADGGVPVTGTVVDDLLAPFPGATVRIGTASTTTDSKGKFTLANVGALYDAVVQVQAQNGRPHGYVFGALARRDPTLQLLFDAAPGARVSSLSGTTATGTMFNIAGVVFADFAAPAMAATGNHVALPPGQNTFSGALAWSGGVQASGTLYDLQWISTPDGGLPTGFLAFASEPTTFTANQPTSWAVLPVATIPEDSMSVAANVTGGYTLAEVSYYLRPQGANIAAPIGHVAAPSNPQSLPTPVVGGATFVACAVQGILGSTGSTNVPYGVACAPGLGSNQQVTLTPAPAPTFVGPPSTAGLTTVFAWNALPTGVSLVAFEPQSTAAMSEPALYLLTPLAKCTVPDLASVGLGLPSGAAYQAAVYGFAPFPSTDSATTAAGFGAMAAVLRLDEGPAAPGAFGFSGESPFTVQ